MNYRGGARLPVPSSFSLELSQMVSLSARRIKLAEVEKIDKEITVRQFEELLQSLKMELLYLDSRACISTKSA